MRKDVAMAAAAGVASAVAMLAMLDGDAIPPEDDSDPEPPRPRSRPAPAPAPAPTPTKVYDDHREPYTPSHAAPYGPKFGARRPPGLPTLVVTAADGERRVVVDGIDEARAKTEAARAFRQRFGGAPPTVQVRRVRWASARGAALAPIAEQAARYGHGQAFVDTMTHLAKTEGEGGTFAVPARNFNTPCTARALNRKRLCTLVDAPRRGQLITAWGVYQWNRDAGRQLHALDHMGLRAPRIPPDWMPWDWTAAEEIAVPINYYAQVWALVRRRGGSVLAAARGVRLWHTGPSRFRRYVEQGLGTRAWRNVDEAVSAKIDRHLKNAGVA